jgi:hypothetical protein
MTFPGACACSPRWRHARYVLLGAVRTRLASAGISTRGVTGRGRRVACVRPQSGCASQPSRANRTHSTRRRVASCDLQNAATGDNWSDVLFPARSRSKPCVLSCGRGVHDRRRTPARLELIDAPPPMTNTAFDDGAEVRIKSSWTRHLGFRQPERVQPPGPDCS